MKKILAGLFSIALILVVGLSFVGCDKYSRNSYTMTAFTLYRSDGTERNVSGYKEFFGIDYASEREIKHNYDVELADTESVKEFILGNAEYKFEFDSNNNVTFTAKTATEYVLKRHLVETWTGTYTYGKEELKILFKNYKLKENGENMYNTDGLKMVEDQNMMEGFSFGKASGKFEVKELDGKSFMITMYTGVTTSSDRVEMIFTKD